MKLIVGLGNVGKEYEQTRHNLGFMVVDALVAAHNLPRPTEELIMKAHLSRGKIGDVEVLLAKPTTYMNLSGQSVGALARYYKVDSSDVWVIHDELDLAFGKLRVRQGGGTAGHNGLKSIVEAIGDGFGRYRVGIANDSLRNPIAPDAFVLANFSTGEAANLPQVINQTVDIVIQHLHESLADTTYNLINNEG